jgi:hypothetical protein
MNYDCLAPELLSWTPKPKPQPQVAPTFPNARDCEHGHQRLKCPECELDILRKGFDAVTAVSMKQKCERDRILATIKDDVMAEAVAQGVPRYKECTSDQCTEVFDGIKDYRAALMERITKENANG